MTNTLMDTMTGWLIHRWIQWLDDWYTNGYNEWMTDTLMDTMTWWLIHWWIQWLDDWYTDGYNDVMTDTLMDTMTGWLIHWWIHWPDDWYTDGYIDWMTNTVVPTYKEELFSEEILLKGEWLKHPCSTLSMAFSRHISVKKKKSLWQFQTLCLMRAYTVCRLIDKLIDWLMSWLIDCLIDLTDFSLAFSRHISVKKKK